MTDPTPVPPFPTSPKIKKTRRSRGEGTVVLQKNGLWQARLKAGGKVYGPVYGKTKKEAANKLHDLKERHKKGEMEPSRETLARYLERWLEYIEGRTAASTFHGYAYALTKYVTPDALSELALGKITALHVEEFLARLRKSFPAGDGERTIQGVYVVLKMALKKAVGWGLINANPMADGKVVKPRYKAGKRPVWNPEQTLRFLDLAEKDRLYALYLLALTVGPRHGELLGLQWTDIDWENRTLNVRWSLPEVGGYTLPLKAPKSDAGKRSLPLMDSVVAALRARREASLAEGTAASPYVFPNLEGKPANKRLTYRSFKVLLDSLPDLPRITIHDLRHTAITLLRMKKLDMKLLQVLAGHAQFSLTSDLYAHVLPEEQADVRKAMEGVWGPK